MLSKVTIGKRVRMYFNVGSPGVEGSVEGIERNDDDSINGILLRTPSVPSLGLLDLDEEVINHPGFRIEVLDEPKKQLLN